MKLYEYGSRPRPAKTMLFNVQFVTSRNGRHFKIIFGDNAVGPGKIDVIAAINHIDSRGGYMGYYLIRPEGWRRVMLAADRNDNFYYVIEPLMGRYRVRLADLDEAKESLNQTMSRHLAFADLFKAWAG